ncbi:MAG: glycosyltransferase family 4 protein [Ignavibacteriaceae bacterium]|nr:glycosyltransferase family 4 protein [Ignavibacteriaceae bacterium]
MRILFLTQYFPPETGAPQNRLFALAKRLKAFGANVSILTAMPNYPKMEIMINYTNKFYVSENLESLDVHRAYIFVKNSKSLVLRMFTYFSFVLSSLIVGLCKINKQDYIFCESPPLFLGISALILYKVKKANFIFNVSDLWPESAEKLGLVRNKFFLYLTKKLEETLYKNAYIISGQTQGIVKNIQSRFPEKNVYWLKNGMESFENNIVENISWREKKGFSPDDFIVLYAGIIGFAQGLDVILKAAKTLVTQSKIKFILLGDGPEKQRLLELNSSLNLQNVYFFDSEPKSQMPFILNSIDAAVVPLKKIDLFKGAIPSKIFEILSAKKPLLLGVEGEAEELFINQGKAGLKFEPDNGDDLANKILVLFNDQALGKNMGMHGYIFVKKNFNNDSIAENFWELINSNLHKLMNKT